MSSTTLTKHLFYSGVLEICCQVCHTATQLRHLFLDPLQRRGAFGILANSRMFRFKMDLDLKKKHANSQCSRIPTFLHLSLCLFFLNKNFNKKNLSTPHPPLPPSPPWWFYFPPALVLQVAVPWELPVGPLEVRHCPASHPPQGCQSFAPWTHRLRVICDKNHRPRGCF